MKKSIYAVLIFLMVLSINSFAMGDLEELLLSDETSLENELLGEEQVQGDLLKGEVKELIGQALIKKDEEEVWKQAFKGMEVEEGTTVVTMEKSEIQIELLNGAIVDLRPKTQAYFKTMRQDPEKKELTETGIKLFVGKIYSNVKKLVDTGSKYKVETSSATAGVRGTKFSVEVTEIGETLAEVYEGTVAFSSNLNPNNIIEIIRGERARVSSIGLMGEKEKHNNEPPKKLEEKKLEKIESKEEKKEEVKEEEEEKKVKKDKKSSGFGFSMEAGTKVVKDISYGTLELKPEFKNIFGTPIGLGLKITLLQGQDGDKKVTKYGPGASDEWYDSISLRWAEYNGKVVGLRYGELGGINYGHGLLMENYSTFGLRTRLTLKNNRIYGFVPLKEGANTERDNLYGARYERRVYKGFFGGITYLTDLDEEIEDSTKIPTSAIGVDGFYELSRLLIPYFEYDMLEDFGDGYEAGIKGGVSFLDYKFGYRAVGEKFEPTLYDQFYETRKLDLDLKEVTESYSGYLGQIGLHLFSLVDFQVRYEDYPDIELNRLKGDLNIAQMSFLPGMWSRIQMGAAYKQIDVDLDDFEWLDKGNTSVYGYMVYPASDSVDIKFEYVKDPGEEKYTTFKTIIRF